MPPTPLEETAPVIPYETQVNLQAQYMWESALAQNRGDSGSMTQESLSAGGAASSSGGGAGRRAAGSGTGGDEAAVSGEGLRARSL